MKTNLINIKPNNPLFHQIQQCHLCPSTVSEKVARKLDKVNLKSKVFLIAEAMAPNQVRVSGVNYFDINGHLGATGKNLEKFLNKFNYSVYPGENCIYHTEIVHCFPGYNTKSGKKTIRRPTISEITNCLNQKFVQQEIDLIKPKIILLMGQTSYKVFYQHFLHQKISLNLSDKIAFISKTGQFDSYQGIPLIPLQHASGANPRFTLMVTNHQLIKIIQDIISNTISSLYHQLLSTFGDPDIYWPQWCSKNKSPEDREKIIIGMILVQHTSWHNVNLALKNLKKANLLSLEKIAHLKSLDGLTSLIRPAGFYSSKPRRLFDLCHFIITAGGIDKLMSLDTSEIRSQLLQLKGVGPETADTILLYAFDKPIFIIDEYTYRWAEKHSLFSLRNYSALQQFFHQHFTADLISYQNLHALIIISQRGPEKSKMEII